MDSFQLGILGDSLKIIWRFFTSSSSTITTVITTTTVTTLVHSATENFKSFCPGLISALVVMTEWQNHRIVKIGNYFCWSFGPNLLQNQIKQVTQSTCRWIFNAFRGEDSMTSLSWLFQCSIIEGFPFGQAWFMLIFHLKSL